MQRAVFILLSVISLTTTLFPGPTLSTTSSSLLSSSTLPAVSSLSSFSSSSLLSTRAAETAAGGGGQPLYVSSLYGDDSNSGRSESHPVRTIRAALAKSNPNDRILLNPLQPFTNASDWNNTVPHPLTVQSLRSNIRAEVSCRGATGFILQGFNMGFGQVTLKDLRLTDCKGTALGFSNTSLLLDNVVLDGHVGDVAGGLFAAQCESVVIIDTTISNCVGAIRAGGALLSASGSVEVSRSTFINNSQLLADSTDLRSAGGILFYDYRDSAVINRCHFIGNVGHPAGAVMFTMGFFSQAPGRAYVVKSVFEDNDGRLDAGGVVAEYVTVEVHDTKFHRCRSVNEARGRVGSGGGMSMKESNVIMTATEFVNCSAQLSGGGVFAHISTHLEMVDVTFAGCSAAQYGGALFAELSTTIVASHIEMYDCTCTLLSAGFAIRTGSTLHLSHAYAHDMSSWYGTFVSAHAGSEAVVNDSVVTRMHSDTHSPWAFSDSGTVRLTRCNFSDVSGPTSRSILIQDSTLYLDHVRCQSVHSRGAAFVEASSFSRVFVNSSDFRDAIMVQATSGGGFVLKAGSVMHMYDSVVHNTVSQLLGGGCLSVLDGSEAYLYNSQLSGCAVRNSVGGAVYLRQYSWVVLTNSSITSSSAVDGGAVACTSSSQLVIVQSRLHNNKASPYFGTTRTGGNGGGIIATGGCNVQVTDSVMSHQAARVGGAALCSESRCAFDDVLFLQNGASYDGGAIYFAGTCNDDGNSAPKPMRLDVVNSKFRRNIASGGGGGGIFFGDAVCRTPCVNCTWQSNSAMYGDHSASGTWTLVASRSLPSSVRNGVRFGAAYMLVDDMGTWVRGFDAHGLTLTIRVSNSTATPFAPLLVGRATQQFDDLLDAFLFDDLFLDGAIGVTYAVDLLLRSARTFSVSGFFDQSHNVLNPRLNRSIEITGCGEGQRVAGKQAGLKHCVECERGSYNINADGSCHQCPAGTVCKSDSLAADENFWQDPSTPLDELTPAEVMHAFYECEPYRCCPDGGPTDATGQPLGCTPDIACAEFRKGTLCSECTKGRTLVMGNCVLCDGLQPGVLLSLTLVLTGIMVFLMQRMPTQHATFSVAIFFFQNIPFIMQDKNAIGRRLELLNIRLSSASPSRNTCLYPFTPLQDVYNTYFALVAMWVLLTLLYVLLRLSIRSAESSVAGRRHAALEDDEDDAVDSVDSASARSRSEEELEEDDARSKSHLHGQPPSSDDSSSVVSSSSHSNSVRRRGSSGTQDPVVLEQLRVRRLARFGPPPGTLWGRLKRRVLLLFSLQRSFTVVFGDTVLQVFLFTYSSFTATSADLVVCREVAGKSVLAAAPSVECWTGEHLPWGIVGVTVLVVLSVLVPIAAMVYVYRAYDPAVVERNARSPFLTYTSGTRLVFTRVLYLPFNRKNMIYFGVILLRRSLIIFVSVFFERLVDRSQALMGLLLVFIALHIWRRPYARRRDNFLETLSLSMLVFVAQLEVDLFMDTPWHRTSEALQVVVLIVFAMFVGWLTLRRWWRQRLRRKARQTEQASANRLFEMRNRDHILGGGVLPFAGRLLPISERTEPDEDGGSGSSSDDAEVDGAHETEDTPLL